MENSILIFNAKGVRNEHIKNKYHIWRNF